MIRVLCVFCACVAIVDTFVLLCSLKISGRENRKEKEMEKKEDKNEED